jgi:dolichol-phosphate mannosyltransferase
MSGFFFFKRRAVERKDLNPSGYKIGLEIFVKNRFQRMVEMPYAFSDRKAGKSKLGLKEDVQYLIHLARLYWYRANN